jgi:hypothetical protein
VRAKENIYRIDGCRYNQRLNTKTEGSKTSHILWVEGKHTVSLALVVGEGDVCMC